MTNGLTTTLPNRLEGLLNRVRVHWSRSDFL